MVAYSIAGAPGAHEPASSRLRLGSQEAGDFAASCSYQTILLSAPSWRGIEGLRNWGIEGGGGNK